MDNLTVWCTEQLSCPQRIFVVLYTATATENEVTSSLSLSLSLLRLSLPPSLSPFISLYAVSLPLCHSFMPEYNMYRVLHSMHASYSEVCDFITYLKPRRIVPCVIPVGDASLSDVNRRLALHTIFFLPYQGCIQDFILEGGGIPVPPPI